MAILRFPFCPHADCPRHWLDDGVPYTDYESWGSYSTRTFGIVPRCRCRACGHTFSSQTFSLDYYAKRLISYHDLLGRLAATSSLSAIGRAYSASPGTVSNRISRTSRQAFAFDSRLSRTRAPSENRLGYVSISSPSLKTQARISAWCV